MNKNLHAIFIKKWRQLAQISCIFVFLVGNLSARAISDVSAYFFIDGVPAPQFKVTIDEQDYISNSNAAMHLELNPGTHHFSTDFKEFNYEVQTFDDEHLRLIFTFYTDQRPTHVRRDSSHELARDPHKTKPLTPHAQTGSGQLTGHVISAEDGASIVGARVYINGITEELVADQQGNFNIELPVGHYVMSVLHPDFSTHTINPLIINKDKSVNLSVEMTPKGIELEEFVILVPYIEGSLSSVIEERRESSSVSEILGSEQMSRSGDSDTAGALKRVTGLTLVNGEFVFIRGLGERYSSTLLNGADVPSPDPTRKVVPLNMFPTSIVESIVVKKSYEADLPGEFGGGTIILRTRSIPENNFLKLSTSTGVNSQSSFKKGYTYQGGNTDWSGRDDGTREFPPLIEQLLGPDNELNSRVDRDILTQISLSLPRIYDRDEKKLPPFISTGISLGQNKQFNEDWRAGYIAGIDYQNKWKNKPEHRSSFVLTGRELEDGSPELVESSFSDYEKTTQELSRSIYISVGLDYQQSHHIKAYFIDLLDTEDETSQEVGINEDTGNGVKVTHLTWQERNLVSKQIEGEHSFSLLSDLSVSWLLNQSTSTRYAPDERYYRFNQRSNGNYIFSIRSTGSGRNWSTLKDSSKTHALNASLPFETDHIKLTLKAGLNALNKKRDSEIRRFYLRCPAGRSCSSLAVLSQDSLEDILSPENIGSNGFLIREQTNNTDSYLADQSIDSWYTSVDFTWVDRVRLYAGVRKEKSETSVTTFQQFDPEAAPIESKLANNDLLPSIASTLYFSDQLQLRLSYAKTVNRPQFRELSPATFEDPLLDLDTHGNPDLKQASISHYDTRLEYYFSETESISISGFLKDFSDPIERVLIPGAGLNSTFNNAQSAKNYGLELDFHKRLQFLNEYKLPFSSLWDKLYIAGNYSWIHSEITLDESNAAFQSSSVRPLQGQSPYIVNAQIGYDDEQNGTKATLLFNTSGERISDVGSSGIPDVYEQPFKQLDFTLSKEFHKNWRFKLKLSNLLDDEVKYLVGNETQRNYKKGREIVLGISWKKP